MNYSNWTDFAINAAVGAATGLAKSSEPAFSLVIRNSDGGKFDPCNSWADAGPIIEKQELGIVKVLNGWCATHDADEHGGVYTVDTSPLRAAMIVFLMMQESK